VSRKKPVQGLHINGICGQAGVHKEEYSMQLGLAFLLLGCSKQALAGVHHVSRRWHVTQATMKTITGPYKHSPYEHHMKQLMIQLHLLSVREACR
jgi:hypothetical protein